MTDVAFLQRGAARIAYRRQEGGGPGVMFCGGFHSDMDGTKASRLAAHLEGRGQAYLRFDYQGHGRSSGDFADGTIGLWFGDALAALDALTAGPQIVIGSSMGGWMALKLALARPDRVAGLILLAPAPDFPTRLMLPAMDADALAALARDGVWYRPSEYEPDPYPITRTLIEQSRAETVLDRGLLPVQVPVHILHGDADEVVPLSHVLGIPPLLASRAVVTEIVKGGDHPLSGPADLDRLCARCDEMTARIS